MFFLFALFLQCTRLKLRGAFSTHFLKPGEEDAFLFAKKKIPNIMSAEGVNDDDDDEMMTIDTTSLDDTHHKHEQNHRTLVKSDAPQTRRELLRSELDELKK